MDANQLNQTWDCVIIGSGACGLSAAINGASEGLSTLVIDKNELTGGLIGTTSLIENYPGFPEGITGRELTNKMECQARKFGAEFLMGYEVYGIIKQDIFVIQVANKDQLLQTHAIQTKSVILSTGRWHKKLGLSNELELVKNEKLEYGHPDTSKLYKGSMCVVGGGNSAGQAATWLADIDCKVTIVAPHLHNMSDYLVTRIKENKKIHLTLGKVIHIHQNATDLTIHSQFQKGEAINQTYADHVFSLIGLEVDNTFTELKEEHGFLCNKIEGLFVAGDCRYDSEKRCTAAVGEGVVAVSKVKSYIKSLS
jgi:thioredoxin reductase (NADPH)